MNGVIWTVMSFVVASIGIMVGVLVSYNVQLAKDFAEYCSSDGHYNVASTAGSGFALLTVSLIVIATSVILGHPA